MLGITNELSKYIYYFDLDSIYAVWIDGLETKWGQSCDG